MATYIYTGNVGGGKSYAAVEDVMRCLSQGGYVATNLPLNYDHIAENYPDWLPRITKLPKKLTSMVTMRMERDPETGEDSEVFDCPYATAGSEGAENLIVIDEASLQLNVDEQGSNKAEKKPLFALSALCRHVGLDLIYISQHKANLDVKVRRLGMRVTECVNARDIPMFGWLIRKFGDFVRFHYVRDDPKWFDRTFHKFDPKVGAFYTTHGMANSVKLKTGDGKRVKPQDRDQKKGKAILVAFLAFAVAVIWFAVHNASGIYNRRFSDKVEESIRASDSPPPVPVASGGVAVSRLTETRKSDEGVTLPAMYGYADSVLSLPYVSRVYARGVTRVIHLLDGSRLAIGSTWRGQQVLAFLDDGGLVWVSLNLGATFVCRPLSPEEREERRPGKVQPLPTAVEGIASAMGQAVKK